MIFMTLPHDNQSTLSSFSLLMRFEENSAVTEKVYTQVYFTLEDYINSVL